MTIISDVTEFDTLYGLPSDPAVIKVMDRLNEPYRRMIEASPFVTIATVGPEGLDCSPRGDEHSVIRVVDDKTLHLPDWRGNNRVDSLRNIVRDPRIGMLFLIPGSGTTMRLNGRAVVSIDPLLLAGFERDGKNPRSVVVITIDEVFSQCARAIHRSQLWNAERHHPPGSLPTVGDMLAAAQAGFDGKAYDENWAERAKKSMW